MVNTLVMSIGHIYTTIDETWYNISLPIPFIFVRDDESNPVRHSLLNRSWTSEVFLTHSISLLQTGLFQILLTIIDRSLMLSWELESLSPLLLSWSFFSLVANETKRSQRSPLGFRTLDSAIFQEYWVGVCNQCI